MPVRSIRVVPADVGWVLEIGGVVQRTHRFPTLEAAICAGWDLAKSENVDLQLHDLDSTPPAVEG
ncbi:DUF2188 domain-containing protein [Cupriavidus taiwanensis]|uniref:DUF2188 domain-containing protein n=1 Tax=Cupriavidus taiwanensis TaxID=164546 RepID=UPI000E1FC58B|nr:DUF2188 domain-containing protein [Cupriavidus taiwanensis]